MIRICLERVRILEARKRISFYEISGVWILGKVIRENIIGISWDAFRNRFWEIFLCVEIIHCSRIKLTGMLHYV